MQRGLRVNFRSVLAALLLVPVLTSAAPEPALLKRAQAGDPAAELEVFEELSAEAKTAKAHVDAEKYLRRAAERGHAPAQVRLAKYLSGLRFVGAGMAKPSEKDLAEAASWWKKAADQKVFEAQKSFGFIAAEGRGMKRDVTMAVQYLEAAGRRMDPDALKYLVKLYWTGEDAFGNKRPIDHKKAIAWQEQISLPPTASGNDRLALAKLLLQQPQVADADRARAKKLVADAKADRAVPDAELRGLLGETDAPAASAVVAPDPQAVARAAAIKPLEAHYPVFEREFNAASDRAGRESAIRNLDAWILANYRTAEDRAHAGDWVLRRMADLFRRNLGEAVHLLPEFSRSVATPEVLATALPVDVVRAVREDANRAQQEYAEAHRKRGEIERHLSAARAQDELKQREAGKPAADLARTDSTSLRKFRPWTFAEIKAELARGTDQVNVALALGQDRATDLTRDTIFAQIGELKQTVRGPLELALAVVLSDIARQNSLAKAANPASR